MRDGAERFSTRGLDTFDGYLNALVEQRQRALGLEKLGHEKLELKIPVPDYTAEAWNVLRAGGKLLKSRAKIPFSPRKDGAGRPVPTVTFRPPPAAARPY